MQVLLSGEVRFDAQGNPGAFGLWCYFFQALNHLGDACGVIAQVVFDKKSQEYHFYAKGTSHIDAVGYPLLGARVGLVWHIVEFADGKAADFYPGVFAGGQVLGLYFGFA